MAISMISIPHGDCNDDWWGKGQHAVDACKMLSSPVGRVAQFFMIIPSELQCFFYFFYGVPVLPIPTAADLDGFSAANLWNPVVYRRVDPNRYDDHPPFGYTGAVR